MAILHSFKNSIKKNLIKIPIGKAHQWSRLVKVSFWFFLGAMLGFFFFTSFLYIFYQKSHANLVYSGVVVNGVDFGGKTRDEVREYFAQKNKLIQKTTIVLIAPTPQPDADPHMATISAQQINFGYDANLLADQAYSIGRSDNNLSNMSLILQAYTDGVQLSPAYHYSDEKINKLLKPLQAKLEIKPVDALFNFENGKVVTFRFSKDGKTVDTKKLKEDIFSNLFSSLLADTPQTISIKVPLKTLKPQVTDDKASKMGIKELIAEGTSLFQHSIENRIFNISLAAARLNGTLIPPGQTFSFGKTVGDVSTITGYRQAYVIENGKTVLGDGGGICQVSTTLFRAALNAGLPIVERHPHAYRVGYYEQDSGPGIDAAVYIPGVDLKFKNDTGHHILIQSFVDLSEQRLTFSIYGTKDNRDVVINQPIITSESPAPETLYQDDPTLPKGQLKQIDFSAAGANVFFTRQVKKDGKVILSDKFVSNYRPWQAIFLRGTKE